MKTKALLLGLLLVFTLFVGCISEDKNDVIDKIDTDEDGTYDHIDAFPGDPAASIDSDGDGFPDKEAGQARIKPPCPPG